MKKIIKLFLLCLIAFCVIGCVNPVNNNTGDDENKPVDTTELKKALYEKLLGTWELKEGQYTVDNYTDTYFSIVFASDSITLDGQKYEINLSEDLFLETEISEQKRMDATLYVDINGLHYITFDTGANNVSSILVGKIYYSELNNRWASKWNDFVRVSDGNESGEPGEELDFSVVGDWGYTIAAGNTKTTFSIEDDGTFSFTKNSDVTNGTYFLSGNKITFKFTKDVVETEDTFTISGSEEEITLTLVESKTVTNGQTQTGTAISNMLLAFYTTTEKTITLSK